MLKLLLASFLFVFNDVVFFILIIALVGLIYPSMVAFSQIDIKKIIAYSSIAHMNFSLIGLFSQSIVGLMGVFVLMLGHAITSGALFLGIGVLYDRYKTRIIFYYGSLATFMPVFSIIYFFFVLSNFGFPGTVNFVGEFLILVSGIELSNVIIFLSSFGLILSLVYSLFFYGRIFFGPIPNFFIRFYSDMTRLEFLVLFIFFFFVILLGIYPNFIFDFSLLSLFRFNYFFI